MEPIAGRTVYKVVSAETKVDDLGRGMVHAVLSTEAEDRQGDVIRQSGWANLEKFMEHPVLLAGHDYFDIRAQIGEWEDVRVRAKRLEGLARYYIGEGNEQADWGFKIAAKGRAAYSVGFLPLEWKERSSTLPHGRGYEYLQQDLLEASHVSVPANAEALQLMVKLGMAPPEVLDIAQREWEELGAGIVVPKLWEETEKEIRYRIRDPGDFIEDSFRTIELQGVEGIRAIMGKLKEDGPGGPMKMQALRFEKEAGWTMEKAKEWVKKHPDIGKDLDDATTAEVEQVVNADLEGDGAWQKAGRVMSQANLDKLHSVMDRLGDIHEGVCDIVEGCPVRTFSPVLLQITKGALPTHTPPKADEGEDWEAPGLGDFTGESWDDLGDAEKRRIMMAFAWSKNILPEKYGDLKLPHHRPSNGNVVWRGVAAAMGTLLGARGGVDIPDADRRGVYRHLEVHYQQFDKEPPELRAAEPESRANSQEVGTAWLARIFEGLEEGLKEEINT